MAAQPVQVRAAEAPLHKMNKRALIVFQKNAIAGKVKTRLAATIGNDAALVIYKKLVNHTHAVIANVNADVYLFFADTIEKTYTENYTTEIQCGKNLGERMQNAFSKLFNLNYNSVCIIGTDCIELNDGIITNAFEALEKHDYVLGKAKDGGYYLLGMKKNNPDIFKNVEWSTEKTAEQTVQQMLKTGNIFYLPTLNDIDNETDWNNYLATVK
jgi:rSAM/selenodomain-associated transferase 1